MYSVQLLINYF